ncbi:MAG TPA: hypothetical protein PK894_04035 [Defluviitoga sp.]|nr:hypothetical protein [Defluviitoga sp.]HOP24414.1 hypothetical protein [Defluviitoga sp.]HPZ28749.1 hypothetical protein [Defluviitoga sp.]HQD62751.1 hypothetical protein [Defluviitoga sp.]
MNIERAIISVYDKSKIENIARFLFDNDVEIICTQGTSSFLEQKGIKTIKMSDFIGFPEILGGRIKSIDPKLLGGILAKSTDKNHIKDLMEYNIKKIDMVIVNFPSFEEIVQSTRNEETLLNFVDIGGFTLVRAAAKNYRDVVPLVDPKDYDTVLENLEECGDVPLQLRRKLALKVFFSTSKYDATIHKVFSELFASEKFDHEFFEILGELRFGANPLQEAMLLKFLGEDSFIDHLENITPYKKPTLRILKDIKLLFSLVSLTESNFIGFSKKGIFVHGLVDPDENEKKQFVKLVKDWNGGVIYSDDENLLEELKDSRHDCLLTSRSFNEKERFLSYKPMVLKIYKKSLGRDEEYVIEDDLVVKQKSINLTVDTEAFTDVEKIAFEVAKIHRSDTVVYIKDNKIYSGNQACVDRKIALNILNNILKQFEEEPSRGTIIFDSSINSEEIVNMLQEWKIEKVIIPPHLPAYGKFLNELKNNNVEIITTSRRYHRY